jgi:hypothetical protein
MNGEIVFLDEERVQTAVLMYLKDVHGISMGKVRSIRVSTAKVCFEEGVKVPRDFDKVPATVQAGGGI